MTVDVASLAIRVESLEAEVADKRLDSLTRSGAKAERSFAAMAAASIGLAAAMAGVVSAYGFATRKTREFSTATSELSAITGATGDDLRYLSDEAKRFGATTTLTAAEAAKAFQLVASAKPDLLGNVEALSATTEAAIALAEATGESLPSAADTLGSALNQFKSGAGQAERFINVLAAGSLRGASLVGDVAEALKFAGVVAADAGLSFEQTNASIQLLSQFAIKGSEAGTALRNVLLTLNTATDEKLRPSVVGLDTALENLAEKQLTETELLDLFDRRSIVVAKTLLNNRDRLRDLTAAITDTNVAHEQASTRVDNLDGDLKRLNSAWEAINITVGERFTPTQRSAAQAMTDIVTAFNQYIGVVGAAEEQSLVMRFALGGLAKFAFRTAVEFKDLGDLLGSWAAQVAAIAQLDFDRAADIGRQREQNRAALEEEIKLFNDRVDFGEQSLVFEKERTKELEKQNEIAGGGAGGGGGGGRTGVDQATIESNQRALDAAQQRYSQGIELVNRQADAEVAALEKLTDLTIAQESQRADAVRRIREQEAADIRQLNEDAVLAVAERTARTKDLEQQNAQQQLDYLLSLTSLTAEEEARRTDLVMEQREKLLDAIRQEAEQARELMELRAEDEIARLEEMTGLAEEEEQRRAELILAIRQSLAEQLVGLEQRTIEAEMRARKRGLTDLQKFEQLSARARTQTVLGEMVNLTQGVAQNNKILFNINKAAALANAIVSLPEHVSKTMAKYPYPLSVVMGALAAAASLAQINAIRSASFEGGGGGTTPSSAGTSPVINDFPTGGGGSTLEEVDQRSVRGDERSVQILVTGNVGFTPDIIDQIADGIKEATSERDVVIFNADSRQAREVAASV